MAAITYPPVKPHGILKVSGGSGYKRVDVPKIIPSRDGKIDHELYLNVTYHLDSPTKAGKVRVKLVREAWHGQPEDSTSYQGYWLMPGFTNFLITRVCWEIAEAHRPCHWEIRVDGADIEIGTRYSKAWQA
jgi:hypothetical protein